MYFKKYLYFLIIFFATGQFFRINLSNGLVIHLTDLGVIALFTWWLIKYLNKRKGTTLFRHQLFRPLLYFALVTIVSLLVNSFKFSIQELLISSLYSVRWILYTCLIFITYSYSEKEKVKIIKILSLSGLSVVFAGFIQYFFYPNLRNLYYAGWDDHLYRLFSTHLDPNFTAVMICLLLFIFIPLLLVHEIISKTQRYILFIGFLLSFIALLLTYSRGGFIMFLVGGLISLFLLKKKSLISYFLSVLLLGIILIPKDFESEGVKLFRTASISARIDSASDVIAIIRDNPIFGVGFNTYRYVYKDYGFANQKNWEMNHSGAGTDNSFLFILATTGVVGFLAYIYLIASCVKYLWNIYIEEEDFTKRKTVSIIALSSILSLCVNSLFINSLFYPAVMFWIWILMGTLLEKNTK